MHSWLLKVGRRICPLRMIRVWWFSPFQEGRYFSYQFVLTTQPLGKEVDVILAYLYRYGRRQGVEMELERNGKSKWERRQGEH